MERTSETLRLGRRACPRFFAGIQVLFVLAVILAATGLSWFTSPAMGRQAPRREIIFPVSIQWNKQKGVTRYRVQIAADEKFQDVFFDGRVSGNRFVVSSLSPGDYFWRVAPADSQAGGFSRPTRFFVSGGVLKAVRLPNRRPGAR